MMKTTLFLILGLVASLHAQTSAPVSIDASKHPNLQAALDAVPESGGLVTIPPGNYEITEPLRVKTAETRIVGGGAATHILNKSETGTPAFILRPANLDADKKARLWRVQLADLRIMWPGEERRRCLCGGHPGDLLLRGMSIDHHGGHGIHLVDCYEDPRIADCILTYNKRAGSRSMAATTSW
jgi:hypothetical protein